MYYIYGSSNPILIGWLWIIRLLDPSIPANLNQRIGRIINIEPDLNKKKTEYFKI